MERLVRDLSKFTVRCVWHGMLIGLSCSANCLNNFKPVCNLIFKTLPFGISNS
jgi:hypothetical protein